MNIRYATEEDVDQIYALGETVSEFSVNDGTVNFWPKASLKNAVASKDTLIIVAEEDGKVTGFIITIYNEGFRKAAIENIYVDPELRNQGVGRLLLEELLEQLNARKCEYVATLVPVGADSATSLYESEGFSRGEQFLWLDKSLNSNFTRTGV